jgi:guanylate kinase
LIFDVDVQGAKQLKERLEGVYLVFIFPPSRAVLEERLRLRRADTDAAIGLRLTNALSELRQADRFDAWIVNDDQERAFAELHAVYRAACLHPGRRPEFLRCLLDEFCKG